MFKKKKKKTIQVWKSCIKSSIIKKFWRLMQIIHKFINILHKCFQCMMNGKNTNMRAPDCIRR